MLMASLFGLPCNLQRCGTAVVGVVLCFFYIDKCEILLHQPETSSQQQPEAISHQTTLADDVVVAQSDVGRTSYCDWLWVDVVASIIW